MSDPTAAAAREAAVSALTEERARVDAQLRAADALLESALRAHAAVTK
jgi:hypothetical protein